MFQRERQKTGGNRTARKSSEEKWLMFLLFHQVMAYNGIATVLYLTAFLANAASVHPFIHTYFYGHMAAAAVRCLTPLTLTPIQRTG